MIYVNDRWESVNTVDDIIRICKENVNDDFAYKVKEIFDWLEVKNVSSVVRDIDNCILELEDIRDRLLWD